MLLSFKYAIFREGFALRLRKNTQLNRETFIGVSRALPRPTEYLLTVSVTRRIVCSSMIEPMTPVQLEVSAVSIQVLSRRWRAQIAMEGVPDWPWQQNTTRCVTLLKVDASKYREVGHEAGNCSERTMTSPPKGAV